MAENALMDMLSGAMGEIPGGGRADDVPAMLSEGEYVIPADIVSMVGDGNTDAGVKAFDALVDNIRRNYKGSAERPVDNQALKGPLNARGGPPGAP